MARSLYELQEILKGLDGVNDAFVQPPTDRPLPYPCIKFERDSSWVSPADNIKFLTKKGYTVIVMDRDPGSVIPDQVEALPFCRWDRYYRTDGIHHFAFHLFF